MEKEFLSNKSLLFLTVDNFSKKLLHIIRIVTIVLVCVTKNSY